MRALKFITDHVTYNPAYTYKFQLMKPPKRQKTYLLEHDSKYNLLELIHSNHLKGLRSV